MLPPPSANPAPPAVQPPLDPGFGVKYTRPTKRNINHDGTFNVRRQGRSYRPDLFQWLITMSWGRFMGLLLLVFVALNVLFAGLYLLIGIEHLKGAEPGGWGMDFLSAMYFSVQTLTTVGYGTIAPEGVAAGFVASVEALVGVLFTFALLTGVFYGRFSRPTARILFSRQAIISQRPSGTPTLQFRIANQRHSTLVEMKAKVLVMFVQEDGNRHYEALALERKTVDFFPLNWTLVHDITPESPLHGLTAEDYQARSLELLILIKGYDDTFAQNVHARNSYRYDEIEWNRRYTRPYHIAEDGVIVLDLDKLHETEAL
ncbi:inward rectifier potassium channel family protein [Hymenobacter weizhouensis]|uniref:inward rectifier potassium channel family protein n=1 Tax=Hymenobacter sp. YIM 151500-1 TaxID=2987689 RepID=UPI002226D8C8|nr:inward rectifier potassium channel family protein [Hymenobacter sp. YIM 151500-1]UYZ62462.1 inward rectifier potassium channel family protein [Hymenobacter sp. YIM 151500-1]